MTASIPTGVSTSGRRPPRPRGMKGFVYDYIIDRLDRIGVNGGSVEWILTSDVWYDLVDETKDSKWNGALAKYFRKTYNLDIKGPEAAKRRTRETIISYIKDVCDELGIRRANVRILAGDVGYLYYRSNRYAISLDDLDSLKLIGTDLLIIEKQGIAEALKDLANDYGIALLSTRGFLTENALDLASLAESSGANVAILTDDDISGHVIAHKVPSVPRIGIDFDTLVDLEVSELAEGEYYTPDQGHLKYAEENMPDLEELDFLRTRRIEINAVKNKVGSKKLWDWIVRKLEEKYPIRNGNRAVQIPEIIQFMPPEIFKLVGITRNGISRVLEPEIKRVKEELSEYEGIIESVSGYESQIKEEFEELLNSSDVDTPEGGNGNGNGKATKRFLKNLTKDLTKLIAKYDDRSFS